MRIAARCRLTAKSSDARLFYNGAQHFHLVAAAQKTKIWQSWIALK